MLVLGPLLTLVVCALASAIGDRVERRGAGLFVFAQAAALAGRMAAGPAPAWPVILADLILATGLLALAVVSMRGWVLAAIFAVALILICHSLLLDPGHGPVTPLYRAVINALNLVGLGALTTGALQSARRRRAASPTLARRAVR